MKPRDYDKKVNRKERRSAILGALSAKLAAGCVSVVDSIQFAESRTKHATEMLKALDLASCPRVLIVLPEYDEVTHRCFRNLKNVVVRTAPSGKGDETKSAVFSTRDVMVAHQVLIVKAALARIEEVWAK